MFGFLFIGLSLFSSVCLAKSALKLTVPFAPIPTKIIGGKTLLAYEVVIKNESDKTIKLLVVDVNAQSNNTMVEYSGSLLFHSLNNPNPIPAGKQSTLFIWLTIPNTKPLPKRLSHQIAYKSNNVVKVSPVSTAVTIQSKKPIHLMPPLRGENWLAGNGPSNDSDHRRSIINYNDLGPYIPERYAIDWVKYENGSDHMGSGNQNANYFAFGQAVYASANGVVVDIRNTMPNNPHPPKQPKIINPFDRPGNYIVIQSNNNGENNYLVYAHLQANILVTVGQKVKAGDMIGFVGSSGDAGVPHLHFDVVNQDDKGSPFLANGLPYVYNRFILLRFNPNNSSYYLNPYLPISNIPMAEENQLPLDGMFVNFD